MRAGPLDGIRGVHDIAVLVIDDQGCSGSRGVRVIDDQSRAAPAFRRDLEAEGNGGRGRHQLAVLIIGDNRVEVLAAGVVGHHAQDVQQVGDLLACMGTRSNFRCEHEALASGRSAPIGNSPGICRIRNLGGEIRACGPRGEGENASALIDGGGRIDGFAHRLRCLGVLRDIGRVRAINFVVDIKTVELQIDEELRQGGLCGRGACPNGLSGIRSECRPIRVGRPTD